VRNDQIAEHFQLLRNFALEHAEASVILAAID
jgi:Antirestriction protein